MYADALDDADIWSSYAAPVAVALPPVTEPALTEPVRDFALNCPGAARSTRDDVNREAPPRGLLARMWGVDRTDERAQRFGAKGAEKVARELSWLDTDWHVLHTVEFGDGRTAIDHVLIGPAGVITVNTKRHPKATASIGEWRVSVNGQPTDYLRSARNEARRASRLLSTACGHPVPVQAAIVFVDLDEFTVERMPKDVYITTRRHLLVWLKSLPETTDAQTVELIYARARFSTTWQ
jgi:hypothetical protein